MQSSIVSPGSTKPASALNIPGREARRAREQDFVAARNQHHHRRRDARIRDVAARGALFRALGILDPRRRSAAAAIAVRAIPFDDLERTRGDREQRIGRRKKSERKPAYRHPAGSKASGGSGTATQLTPSSSPR
jgi:hypothetical protein